jgi:multidrug resistance efflux pump
MCLEKGCIPTHPLEEVEAAVLANIREQLSALDLNIENSAAPDVSVYDKSIEAAERELKSISSQITKIHELLEQGVYDIDTFLDRRDSLNKRTESLKKHIISEQDRRQTVLNSDLRAASSRIHSVLDVYESCDPAKQNELLRSIIDYIIYNKENRGSKNPFTVFVKLSCF